MEKNNLQLLKVARKMNVMKQCPQRLKYDLSVSAIAPSKLCIF